MGELKIWMIYQIDQLPVKLYGWTSDKSIYKCFIQTRDMSYYKVIKHTIASEDLSEFYDEYSSKELDKRPYRQDRRTFKIVSTKGEWLDISNETIRSVYKMQGVAFIDPRIFNEPIRDALMTLHYRYFYMSNSPDAPELKELGEIVNLNEVGRYYMAYGKYMKVGDNT